jgi:hypothetical protein
MMTLIRTERDKSGDVVKVYRTTTETKADCPLCQIGACEQQVYVCAAWAMDLIVHDKPTVVH